MSISQESYLHKSAKTVFAGWLRDAVITRDQQGYAECLGITWRTNRSGPNYGVWEEYPILSDGHGIDPVWDEIGGRWIPECPIPTYDALHSAGTPPVAILDVAVQSKGLLYIGIEIVHKHDLTSRKKAILSTLGLPLLYKIPADWVLYKVRRPDSIPSEFQVW
jgi:hypothetical protein